MGERLVKNELERGENFFRNVKSFRNDFHFYATQNELKCFHKLMQEEDEEERKKARSLHLKTSGVHLWVKKVHKSAV